MKNKMKVHLKKQFKNYKGDFKTITIAQQFSSGNCFYKVEGYIVLAVGGKSLSYSNSTKDKFKILKQFKAPEYKDSKDRLKCLKELFNDAEQYIKSELYKFNLNDLFYTQEKTEEVIIEERITKTALDLPFINQAPLTPLIARI